MPCKWNTTKAEQVKERKGSKSTILETPCQIGKKSWATPFCYSAFHGLCRSTIVHCNSDDFLFFFSSLFDSTLESVRADPKRRGSRLETFVLCTHTIPLAALTIPLLFPFFSSFFFAVAGLVE